MRRLAADGKSIIFITHRLREVSEVADEVTILRHGRVVADRSVVGLDHRQMGVLMVGASDADHSVEPQSGAAGESLLTLSSVTVEGRGVKALDSVDLVLRRNEIVGVAGISGNGQTALAEVADRKSTRLNSSHGYISYAVFCLKKKKVHNVHQGHLIGSSRQHRIINRLLRRHDRKHHARTRKDE